MSTIIEQGNVAFEIDQATGIGTITFGHPMSNSLPGKILQKLAATITQLGEDDSVKVIILQSEGEKAFCAGASFDELISITDLEDVLKELKGKGIEIIEGIVDRTGAIGKLKSVYMRDPDKNLIEISNYIL